MALGTNLPLWPAILFGYLEPISLFAGWQAAYSSPSTFVSRQIPTPSSDTTPIHPGAIILAYSLGNVFLLLLGMAITCIIISKEARVTKAYLIVIAMSDLGHMAASYMVMDKEMFWGWRQWNDMMWGNLGVSAFLHVNRLVTLAGGFGRIGRRG